MKKLGGCSILSQNRKLLSFVTLRERKIDRQTEMKSHPVLRASSLFCQVIRGMEKHTDARKSVA
jgi:hypothetical protein